uniref:Uncharacterized protein n=1 Tax=Anguilla anguilla TaxID=7936 RepID=A0A0E9VD35_ANGAN
MQAIATLISPVMLCGNHSLDPGNTNHIKTVTEWFIFFMAFQVFQCYYKCIF